MKVNYDAIKNNYLSKSEEEWQRDHFTHGWLGKCLMQNEEQFELNLEG